MRREPIPLDKLNLQVFKSYWEWWLLASGKNAPGAFNCMTISWGSMGVMWGKPFVQVVVRPTRHTYTFMERSDSFTVSIFPPDRKEALLMLGTVSGRDRDKFKDSGLTAEDSRLVSSPSFAEAGLVIECKKIYFDDFEPSRFLEGYIKEQYNNDYHRSYFGEILGVFGARQYVLK